MQSHPEWLHARAIVQNPYSVVGDYYADDSVRAAHLRQKIIHSSLAAWNADSDSAARCLLADGTAVVTQQNGQVCILKLYHGNRRVSLVEVEEILASQKKITI
jgi:hypothetical protein